MIRIVIAEDQQMLLGALASLLSMENDFKVVGKAVNGEEALTLVHQHQPDVCIMDIEMPVKSGLDVAEQLKDQPCKTVVLTTFARAGYFERARQAGVNGYLLKDSPSEELAESIRTIMTGRRVYAPELIDMAFEPGSPLTDREEEVLYLISEGKKTKAIAQTLHLTNGTVRNYVSSILDKLEVDSRIKAVSTYQQKGWFKK
ncbi:response regulator transcription factor [Lentibacillus saliphilus]|uniref:response regulator transcription factor n=1 Tax=Lentibacillus saliphilus TaxID=2737028 RepID=UPI001C2FF2EC|nr:response regulator transcription factor [Lentibacillus saliphilus]